MHATAGDNRPPEGIDPLLDRLNEEHYHVIIRAEELKSAGARLPTVIDDANVGKVGDFAKQLSVCIGAAKDAHKIEKAPFLEAGRKVDGWRASICDPLDMLLTTVKRRVAEFLTAKEIIKRQEQRNEANRLAAEAKAQLEAGESQDARTVMREAKKIRREAETAPAADLSRTHTALGTTASVSEVVAFEVTNKATAVARLADHLDDDAVAKAIRSYLRTQGKGLRDALKIDPDHQPLPGIRFHLERKANIR